MPRYEESAHPKGREEGESVAGGLIARVREAKVAGRLAQTKEDEPAKEDEHEGEHLEDSQDQLGPRACLRAERLECADGEECDDAGEADGHVGHPTRCLLGVNREGSVVQHSGEVLAEDSCAANGVR